MTDFYLTVNSKPSTKGRTCDKLPEPSTELLPDYYDKQTSPIDENPEAVDRMFQEWCNLLFNGYNIAVQGCQSKYKLLCTFKARYLDSRKIPDLTLPATQNGAARLNIITVRLHGFTPITLQKFAHGLFNITDNSKIDDTDLSSFVNRARKSRIHYVFLMHSYVRIQRDNKEICDIINKMYQMEPQFIHMIMSIDHVSAGKITTYLNYRLNLIFYWVNCGESFFFEKTHALDVLDDAACANEPNNIINTRLFERQIDLQALKDIYQALQNACREILKYIIEQFVKKSKGEGDIEEPMKERLINGKTVRRSTRNAPKSTEISFDRLLAHCEAELIVRRVAALNNHLGELIDHNIISKDESTNKIQCLVNLYTCQKFLDHLESLES